MKLLLLYIFISLAFDSEMIGQKVFTTTHASQAEVLLYETKRKSEADIFIYKVNYTSQVNPAEGLWLDVDYRSKADWLIHWTKYKSNADCVVYFVDYRSQAKRNDCYFNCKNSE